MNVIETGSFNVLLAVLLLSWRSWKPFTRFSNIFLSSEFLFFPLKEDTNHSGRATQNYQVTSSGTKKGTKGLTSSFYLNKWRSKYWNRKSYVLETLFTQQKTSEEKNSSRKSQRMHLEFNLFLSITCTSSRYKFGFAACSVTFSCIGCHSERVCGFRLKLRNYHFLRLNKIK